MRKIAVPLWIILAVFLVTCASEPEEMPEVTFDVDGCSYSGPTELRTGDHSISFKDLSDQNQELWTGRILDDHTYQDMLDLQSEPGEYYPQPSWTVHPRTLDTAWDESAGAIVYTWRFDEAGEHYLVVGKDSPPSLWFCGSFQVVEAPDE